MHSSHMEAAAPAPALHARCAREVCEAHVDGESWCRNRRVRNTSAAEAAHPSGAVNSTAKLTPGSHRMLEMWSRAETGNIRAVLGLTERPFSAPLLHDSRSGINAEASLV